MSPSGGTYLRSPRKLATPRKLGLFRERRTVPPSERDAIRIGGDKELRDGDTWGGYANIIMVQSAWGLSQTGERAKK